MNTKDAGSVTVAKDFWSSSHLIRNLDLFNLTQYGTHEPHLDSDEAKAKHYSG
jgi:hypothetical protein